MSISPEIAGLIDEIRNDRTHGASELARQAANVMKYAAEHSRVASIDQFLLGLKEIGQELMSVRPAMAPLFNIISHLLNAILEGPTAGSLDSIRRLACLKADELIESSMLAVTQIAGHTSMIVADDETIMTHSYSSTVVAAMKEAAVKRGIRVIVTRSGPGRTGERIAQQLGLYGVPVTFIDDTAVGLYINTVSKVMVGADRVCADGKVINGIGTYQLALTAKAANTPLLVLCETLKFDPRLKGEEVDLEEKEPFELVETEGLPPAVAVNNPHFDITPPELVSEVVTEKGLLTVEEVIDSMKKQPTSDG